MYKVATVALMLLGGGVTAVQMIEKHTPAARTAVSAPQTVAASHAARSVVINKSGNGHFAVDARVDGRQLTFLVDTGASHIAMPMREAARLGIHPRANEFTVTVHTANGITRAALVELRTIEVGDIVLRNVAAIIHPDEGLSVNLLGMSFLSRVRWTHDRGRLVLEQ